MDEESRDRTAGRHVASRANSQDRCRRPPRSRSEFAPFGPFRRGSAAGSASSIVFTRSTKGTSATIPREELPAPCWRRPPSACRRRCRPGRRIAPRTVLCSAPSISVCAQAMKSLKVFTFFSRLLGRCTRPSPSPCRRGHGRWRRRSPRSTRERIFGAERGRHGDAVGPVAVEQRPAPSRRGGVSARGQQRDRHARAVRAPCEQPAGDVGRGIVAARSPPPWRLTQGWRARVAMS